MIGKLAQVESRRGVLVAALAITALCVITAVGLTALATSNLEFARRLDSMMIAAKISAFIALIASYLVVDVIRAVVTVKNSVARIACTDDLTGLNNRRAFLASAAREISRSEPQGDTLALLIADLDYFKLVNDAHGHRVGDLVLVAVSEVLARSAREGIDIVGRLGGEEFAILLTRCDQSTALGIAEDIRAAIAATRISTPAGEILTTASIGCAPIAAGDSVAAALQRADEALYAAKRGGRNRVATRMEEAGATGPSQRTERQRREPPAREVLQRSA